MSQADPAVYGYCLDFDGDDKEACVLDERNPVAERLTEFALYYVLAYASGEGGGFGTLVADPTRLVQQLAATFPIHCSVGSTEIFEAENILVRLFPAYWDTGIQLEVEIAKPLPLEVVPAFLWDHTTSGGRFHGMFTSREAMYGQPAVGAAE